MNLADANPEVTRLLLEIRSNPDAQLLRFQGGRTGELALQRDVLVRPSMTGLTAAEKELLQVHREEAAWILSRAFFLKYTADTDRHRRTKAYGSVDAGEWRQRLEQQLERCSGAGVDLDEDEVLDRCRVEVMEEWPSLSTLAAASLQLVDCEKTRLYCALDLIDRSEYNTAIRVLSWMIRAGPAPELAWVVHQNLAYVYALMDRVEDAWVEYVNSSRFDDVNVEIILNVFAFSMRVGHVDEALRAAMIIDGQPTPMDSTIDRFTRVVEARRNATRATASGQREHVVVQRTMERVDSELGPDSRRIARALV